MTVDGDRGGYAVRSPISGKKKRYAPGQQAEAREAALLLGELVEQLRRKQALDAGRPTIGKLIDLWIAERLAGMPWDDYTRRIALWRLERIRKDMGTRLVEEIDCLYLDSWLRGIAKRADPFNKWRHMLVLLWRFAVGQKLAAANEAEKVERRCTSRKIQSNRKRRAQLDVAGYTAIYDQAPTWLQVAMDLSLVTLQSRREVVGMRHADFRDGHLFVIRDKVAGDSNMAFIKIKLTAELEAIQSRARLLDNLASPYLVHRRPARKVKGKPHWTHVEEHYLSQAFAEVRDKVARFAEMPDARDRPTFHEIRGLGARLYLARGTSKAEIQALMTHSTPRTTAIYLERGAAGLADSDYETVTAPWSRNDLLGP